MSKVIMVQGTMSNVGKSLLCAGLCRIFKQDGYRVVPFKSQNMALNSFITEEGLEIGRAQAMQAEASGVKPSVYMNPILLKPTSDMGSQIIVNGEVLTNMKAKEYFDFKKELIPYIKEAFTKLSEQADIIVIEGAGSPAEINLKDNDIVNMGLAEMIDAPVLLVGDIDRGGVFAQLLGTLMLLEENEQKRVKGLIVNKFRGDKEIFTSGINMLEEKGKVPVVGVVPYANISLEDEDSLTERFEKKERGLINIAVIRFPRISNFTDFDVFEQIEGVSVQYISEVNQLKQADIIFLPGSKNTIEDLQWLRTSGLEAEIKKLSQTTIIFGICGGYQMLGKKISDPYNTESGGEIRGMELLPVETVLQKDKTRTQTKGIFLEVRGALKGLSGMEIEGYEIHMGKTTPCEEHQECENYVVKIGQEEKFDGMQYNNVYGSYVHGIFDNGKIASNIVSILAERKGVKLDTDSIMGYKDFKESQYNKLADILRENLDMKYIYGILQDAKIDN